MPGHVYMIIGSNKNKLEDIVRDTKKHTSLELRAGIGMKGLVELKFSS